MQITVFGANGKVGSLVVQKLLDKGHTVRAAVYKTKTRVNHPSLTYVSCDVHFPEQINNALKDSEAVISCLGSWGTKTKDIQSSGMQNIIPVMRSLGITRIISLTGSGAKLAQDDRDILNDLGVLVLKIVAKRVYADGLKHIELLSKSDLDWSVVRSPVMYEGTSSGYHLNFQRPKLWHRVNRQDVASALVALLDDTSYSKKSPFIHQGE